MKSYIPKSSGKVSFKAGHFSAGKGVKMPKIKTVKNLFKMTVKGKR